MGISREVQQFVADNDSGEEYGGEEEEEEVEKHGLVGLFAKDDRDMEVFAQTLNQRNNCYWPQIDRGVHTDTGVEYGSGWCILTTSSPS